MCTIINNKRMKKPHTKTFIAYKVFGGIKRVFGGMRQVIEPEDFLNVRTSKIGINKWNETIAFEDRNNQEGFQVFSKKIDAKWYAAIDDFVAEVEIRTEDIVKVGWTPSRYGLKKAYEVKKFNISRKAWENRYMIE